MPIQKIEVPEEAVKQLLDLQKESSEIARQGLLSLAPAMKKAGEPFEAFSKAAGRIKLDKIDGITTE